MFFFKIALTLGPYTPNELNPPKKRCDSHPVVLRARHIKNTQAHNALVMKLPCVDGLTEL